MRRRDSASLVFRGAGGEKGGWRANDANRAVWLGMASRRLTRGRGGAYASRRTRRDHAYDAYDAYNLLGWRETLHLRTRVEGPWAVSGRASMRVGGRGSGERSRPG